MYIELYIILLITVLLFVTIASFLIYENEDDNDNITGVDKINVGEFPFPAVLISLHRKPERYEYVRQQLDILGINHTKLSATDASLLTMDELRTMGIARTFIGSKVEAACAIIHNRAWEHIRDNK